MSFCGVICEFNPFHNGHKYLIEQAKKITGSQIICLMSGEFVQRGTPAIQEKYERAKNAVNNGADVVLELPTIFACSNAENFATGAIKILKALNVKYLAFGVEQANLETLKQIAKLKFENSIQFQNAFKNEINNGINYNTALKRAIAKEIKDEKVIGILQKPNNILAVEYLTAILKLDAKIEPVAIERSDSGYLSNNTNNEFASASAIREMIVKNANFSKFIPKTYNFTKYFDKDCVSKFKNLILYNLRTLSEKQLNCYYDYSEGIEFRIKKYANNLSSVDEIISSVSTPRYRENRITKLVLYPSLNITKKLVQNALKSKPVTKVLAIKKSDKTLLIKTNKNKINLIVSNDDYSKLNKTQKSVIDIDLSASNLYNTIISNQNNNDKKIGTLFL